MRELVYCRLFATCSGFCVPGKDEGELHCRSDITKSEVLIFGGQRGESLRGEDTELWAL